SSQRFFDLLLRDWRQAWVEQMQDDWLDDLALEHSGPIAKETEPINRPTLRRRRRNEPPIHCGGFVQLLQDMNHGYACVEVRECLELGEDLARDDIFSCPGNEPVVQEDRRAWMTDAPDVDLGLPEARLEVLPVALVRIFHLRAGLGEALKNEVLDQIRGG